MKVRNDAPVGAMPVVTAISRIGYENQPFACVTVGLINSAEMVARAKAACGEAAKKNGLELDFKETWYSPPVKSDASCVSAMKAWVEELGMPAMPIISGAGHDACCMSRVAPTGMLFIPCEGGISHNEIENATCEDCGAGASVLLRVFVERANAK